MATKHIHICDFCGKELDFNRDSVIFKDGNIYIWDRWDTFDICDDCFKKFIKVDKRKGKR